MKLISITGFIGSGKDTTADILVRDYGYTKMSFAGPLKDVVAAAFGWDREMLEGATSVNRAARNVPDSEWSSVLGKQGFTPRNALQMIGTEIFKKHVAPDFWVYRLKKAIIESGFDKIVVTDCRYENEFMMLKGLGAKMWKVERGEQPPFSKITSSTSTLTKLIAKPYMKFKYPNVHSSEWAWNSLPFDLAIRNEGSLEDLADVVRKNV